MYGYTREPRPVEKPSAVQLAIREWQRQLVEQLAERKNEQRLAGGSVTC
jgi:NADH:ubiquinone oxidoreductase subunit